MHGLRRQNLRRIRIPKQSQRHNQRLRAEVLDRHLPSVHLRQSRISSDNSILLCYSLQSFQHECLQLSGIPKPMRRVFFFRRSEADD